MKSKGNRYHADTKTEIALWSCHEDRTLSEFSSKYWVSSAQINCWKKTLMERASELFDSSEGLVQFTSNDFTGVLEKNSIRISMDGRGRALDNIFVERLWRSLKYECVYLNNYENVPNLMAGLRRWLSFYNEERPHTSLPGNITPHEMYEPYLNL